MKILKGAAEARRLDRRTLGRGLRCAVRFLMGFTLAQGKVFGAATPFGTAFVAATGGQGMDGLFGALGAAVGSVMAWQLEDGLKYIAACILAFVAVRAFAGSKLADSRFFGAAAASGSLGVVGFVFVAAEGFPMSATLAYICEVALAGGCALIIPFALEEHRGESTPRQRSLRSASRLLLSALILLGLSSIPFFAGMTVGRIAATVLVLSAAAGGGMGAGAAAGVALGAVFDIGGGGGFYTMCYGAAGLLAGVAGGGSRLYAAIAYVLISALAALLDGEHFSALYETFVASVAFMLIPPAKLGLLDFLSPEETGSTLTAERRELAARHMAIGQLLSETARSLVPEPSVPSPDRTLVRTAARVCGGCALRAICWEREREETMSQLRTALARVADRGRVAESDLPAAFRTRCARLEEFRSALGEEYRVGQLQRRREAEVRRDRQQAAVRLDNAALYFTHTAQEVSEGLCFDGDAQRTARRTLLGENCSCDVTAWRLPGGRLCLELSAARIPPTAVAALERALDIQLRDPALEDGRTLLLQRGKFSISAAAATRRRRGSVKNGDCGTYFNAPRGRFVCILADGMGSGEEAAGQSESAVRSMETLLSAGLTAADAADMLCDLSFDGGHPVFSTLDVLVVDDWSQRGELVKLGAAPTYIRAEGRVIKAAGSSSGMIEGARPKRTTLNLDGCDLVVMVTDGVCDGEDGWLRELIAKSDGSAEALAKSVVAAAARRTGNVDDMTAIALQFDR